MMPDIRNLYLLLTIILLTGCGSTPVSHYYMLTTTVQLPITPKLSDAALIGVGPIRFPKYLDRPQIVTRSTNAEIYLAETDRWAEPLQENFTRVLAENLSLLLGTERISIEPSRNHDDVDYRITAEILQFDAGDNGEVVLLVYWSIQSRDGVNLTGIQKSEIRLPLSRSVVRADIVIKLSETIAELGSEIAISISQITTKPTQVNTP